MGFKETLQKWLGTAKDTAADAAEKAGPMVDKAEEAAEDAFHTAKEKAGPMVDKARETAGEALHTAREKAEPYVDKAVGRVREAGSSMGGGAAGADEEE